MNVGSERSENGSPRFWQVALASVWLLVFVGFCFSLELPNNPPIRRGELLSVVPQLVDLVDPPAAGPNDSPQVTLIRKHSGWWYLPQRFDLYAVAGVILAGAWGMGHLVLRAIGVPLPARSLERTVFAIGLGFSGLSLLTLAAGLAGALSRPLLGSAIGLGVIGETLLRAGKHFGFRISDFGSVLPTGGHPVPSENRNPKSEIPRWLWLIVPAPFLLAMLLGAPLPSTDFDVNAYHFLGPKEFLQNGRIGFLPHNVYTSFPFGTEMLTLLAMVLPAAWHRGALAGKCVLMLFGPLTGLALFATGRRRFGTTAGLFAATLFLTTPWIFRISTIAYAEGGLSFHLFAAMSAAMLGVEAARNEKREDRGSRIEDRDAPASMGKPGGVESPRLRLFAPSVRLFFLAGLFAGSAMACKYPGVVSVVIPMFAVVVWNTLRRGKGENRGSKIDDRSAPSPRSSILDLRSSIAYVIGVALTIGPWLLKNLVETGNPVYPLLYTVLGGRDWDAALNDKWRSGHSPHGFSLTGGGQSLINMVIDVAARNDWVNPLLFAFAVLVWFCGDSRRRTRWLWLYAGYLFLSWWLLTHRLDRFWVPMIPVLALLAGAGAVWFCRSASHTIRSTPAPELFVRGAFAACVAAVTLVNLVIVTIGLGGYNMFLLDLNYAQQQAAHISAPEIVYLNSHLPPGSKVLAVGDAELFEARFPVVYNTVFDYSIFEQWCADESSPLPAGERPLRDPEAIRGKLAAEGITHVYANWLEILRYRAPGSYGYTNFVFPDRFAELQRLGVLGPPWTIPDATLPVERFDPNWRAELRRFGRELIFSAADGNESFVTFQVFPVLP